MYDITLVFALAVASGVLLPVLLFAFFFVLYQEYPAFTDSLALEKSEISLLLVGSVVGLLLNVPVFVGDGIFLGFNVGGALIPLVLSIHLLWKHRPRIAGLVISVILVSWASYAVTEYYPSLGIAALFPHYLFPPVLAFVLARFLESKNPGRMLALAYSSGTLGALIGADFVRIPQILGESSDGLLAAIGGAGSLDLVFLSGLLAAALSILSFPAKSWREKRSGKVNEGMLWRRLLYDAWRARRTGRPGLTVQLCIQAVDSKVSHIAKEYGISGDSEDCLLQLRVPPHIVHDYRTLHWMTGTEKDAARSLTTASLTIFDLQKVERERYRGLGRRIIAYVVDMIIVSLITFIIAIPLIRSFTASVLSGDIGSMESLVSLTAIIGILWAVELTYFTVMEWKRGQTVGKKLLGMRVACEDGGRCGFMPVFTRNVLRISDQLAIMMVVTAIPYIMLFRRSERKQRIGDILAGTVVLKE